MIFFIGPRVNERPYPDRLGPRPHHGTHHARSGVDHPQAQNCRATYRPGQVCRRRLPLDRLDAANEPALTAAVRWDSGQRGQTAHPEGLEECPAQETAGRSSVGERDALAAGFCEAVGSCCAVRRTLRSDGKLLTPERGPNAVVILQEYYGILHARPAEGWGSTAVRSAMVARPSLWRRPISGVASGILQ